MLVPYFVDASMRRCAGAPVHGTFEDPAATWLVDAPTGAIAMDDGYRLLISTADASQ